MDSQTKSPCSNCGSLIDDSKLMLHELYCERNCKKCSTCGRFYDVNDLEAHEEEFHKAKKEPVKSIIPNQQQKQQQEIKPEVKKEPEVRRPQPQTTVASQQQTSYNYQTPAQTVQQQQAADSKYSYIPPKEKFELNPQKKNEPAQQQQQREQYPTDYTNKYSVPTTDYANKYQPQPTKPSDKRPYEVPTRTTQQPVRQEPMRQEPPRQEPVRQDLNRPTSNNRVTRTQDNTIKTGYNYDRPSQNVTGSQSTSNTGQTAATMQTRQQAQNLPTYSNPSYNHPSTNVTSSQRQGPVTRSSNQQPQQTRQQRPDTAILREYEAQMNIEDQIGDLGLTPEEIEEQRLIQESLMQQKRGPQTQTRTQAQQPTTQTRPTASRNPQPTTTTQPKPSMQPTRTGQQRQPQPQQDFYYDDDEIMQQILMQSQHEK